MPQQAYKLIRFFRELRRRRVFKSFAMYGATAFILMEAADIMFPRLGLPDWTVTFVIVLLIAGFPLVLVLSWIFDLTPEGLQKTPDLAAAEKSKEAQGNSVESKKSFTLSHGIILSLLVVVCILLYPKLFPGDSMKEIRNEEGLISLVVLPFENQSGNDSLDWFSEGISSLLTNGLGSSDQLLVYNEQGLGEILDGMKNVNRAGLTGSQARDIAGKTKAHAYISGSFMGQEDTYRILARLVSTENGDILFTSQVDGNLNSSSIFDLADSLLQQIRDHLEISVLEQQTDYDYRKAFTSSAEAYRYYIEGMNSMVRADFAIAVELLEKALEIDPSFAFAAFAIAMTVTAETNSSDKASDWIAKANSMKTSLPLIYEQWIDLWYTCVFENNLLKLKRQMDALESKGIESRLFWHDMGITHVDFTGNNERALSAFEKVEQISKDRENPWKFMKYYMDYGELLRTEGKFEEAEKIYQQGLEVFPEDRFRKTFYYNLAVCAMSRQDSTEIEKHLQSYYTTKKALGELGMQYEFNVSTIYRHAGQYKKSEKKIREFLRKYPDHANAQYYLAMTLIEGDINVNEALEWIDDLLERLPGNQILLDDRAWALHKLGKHQEALELLEAYDKQDTGFSLFRYQRMQEVRDALANNN